MAKVRLWGYRCERCGHEWLPRTGEEPRVCPRCKSPYLEQATAKEAPEGRRQPPAGTEGRGVRRRSNPMSGPEPSGYGKSEEVRTGAWLFSLSSENADFCIDGLMPVRGYDPSGPKRDKREYLLSRRSSTGGVQRFKAGHHGGAHMLGAMIAYVQGDDILAWNKRIMCWIKALARIGTEGWSLSDLLKNESYDAERRIAVFKSKHPRGRGLSDISLRHLWIEMPRTGGDG